MRNEQAKGFTLIELVSVIVILGVLATATTQYIIFGARIYVEGNERQQVLTQSRFLIERLTREIRGAVPNSIRVDASNACLEFVPIKASGAYKDRNTSNPVPILPNVSFGELEVVSWDVNQYDVGDRIYIYATSATEIYQSNNIVGGNFAVIEAINENPAAPNYELELFQISGTEDVFVEQSPITRYFTADKSVNYCFVANGSVFDVYRFEKTNFSAAQTVATSPTGVLMAEGLTNNITANPPFEFVDLALTRNSVVNLYLQFEANLSENMFYNHEVHIPNVP